MGKINIKSILTFYDSNFMLESHGLKYKELYQSMGRFKRLFCAGGTTTRHLSTNIFSDSDHIIEILLNKYSLFTVQQSLKVILLILKYHCELKMVPEFEEQLVQIIDMRVNSSLYSKLSNNDINDFLDEQYLHFSARKISFSKYRHFLLLSILIKEIPLRFNTLTNINYRYHNFIEDSDCIQEKVYLVRKGEQFHFIFNVKDQDGVHQQQIIYPIKDRNVRLLLVIYFARYANNLNYLFTTSGGKKCSESNIANSLSNFCRLYLKIPLTLGEIRAGASGTDQCRDNDRKTIMENF